jgi:hypothetical protein
LPRDLFATNISSTIVLEKAQKYPQLKHREICNRPLVYSLCHDTCDITLPTSKRFVTFQVQSFARFFENVFVVNDLLAGDFETELLFFPSVDMVPL